MFFALLIFRTWMSLNLEFLMSLKLLCLRGHYPAIDLSFYTLKFWGFFECHRDGQIVKNTSIYTP